MQIESATLAPRRPWPAVVPTPRDRTRDLAVPTASAFDAGDWSVRVGAHVVDPASDNGTLADGALEVDVDSDWKPSRAVK